MKRVMALNLYQTVSGIKLDKVQDITAKMGIVRLCVELKAQTAEFDDFRSTVADMDKDGAAEVISKHLMEDVVIENAGVLTEDIIKGIIEGNPDMVAGQMAMLMECSQLTTVLVNS